MTDTSENNNNDTSDRRDFFSQFSPDRRDRLKEVWDLAGRAEPQSPDIDLADQEVEEALSEVHRRIGEHHSGRHTPSVSPEHHSSNEKSSSSSSSRWRWWLAAAVVLLVFGAGLLLTPQTVTAPRGEIASVTLPDGSTVELNSGSQISYSRFFSYTNRTIDLEGEAFFSVPEGEDPFIVRGNKAIVRVTGTAFNVRSWSEELLQETEVTVAEGTVDFYPVDLPQQSVTVGQGELSRWAVEMEKPTIPEAVSIDKMLGWREQKLMFNEKPLLVIFQELERRFDVNIQLYDTTMASETLTAFYAHPENVESVIKDICRVKGLRYAETANGYSVYK